MSERATIGFLGAGKMAGALARGFRQAGLVGPAELLASDVLPEARARFAAETGGAATPDNREVVGRASTLIVAVKPAMVTGVLEGIRDLVTPAHLVISIAAGLPIARLERALPPAARVIRVMPNTPALVAASASAFALGTHATAADGAEVQRLFSAVGLALEVPEALLDAVTGLSGSGPAYAYLVIEALSDGGVAAGLPREVATRLAAQTLLGAARMVLETGLHPGTLKDMVTSPGGTTIEGLQQLEQAGVRAAMMNAVRASAEKAARIGKG